ncbi:sugar phosphate nucleotidyltransferase [Egicoccus halophilus]|uniref:Nucleoside-diphosphate-sugar pyrophosphorylase n=1 Tax=Egicoccus halophilus TaxID=1670830 RepID=A0A8J3ESP6_9ACTN|nr:NDP-sugar synthase [Egicoccus halophilus]GGI03894.1 nucleoside-diphosphate-sugar pyrophosphorylase [Egicoccus halophilus]
MTAVREAMIVAGGAGSRLRPLTETTPKPLLPFCGGPFLEGVVLRLAAVGVDRVLLVVGADTAPFETFAGSFRDRGVQVEVVPEPEPLDTAGGVRSALDRVSGTFLVLNGDILTDVDLAAAMTTHRRTDADATLVLTRVEDTSSFGVCVLDGDRITDFVEKPTPGSLPGQDTVNAGTYVLEPDALARFPDGRLSFERTVFPDLVATGAAVHGHVGEAVWADLGTPERFLAGQRLALRGALAWPTLQAVDDDGHGVRVAAGAVVEPGAQLEGPVLVQTGARVETGAQVGPDVVLGPGVQVAAGARLRDTALFASSVVEADVHAEGLLAGTGVRLGRGVRAGRGVVLGDGQRIAAHTELTPGLRRPAPGA